MRKSFFGLAIVLFLVMVSTITPVGAQSGCVVFQYSYFGEVRLAAGSVFHFEIGANGCPKPKIRLLANGVQFTEVQSGKLIFDWSVPNTPGEFQVCAASTDLTATWTGTEATRCFTVVIEGAAQVAATATPIPQAQVVAQPGDEDCSPAPAPRLVIGQKARVVYGTGPGTLRPVASGTENTVSLEEGTEFEVLQGPECHESSAKYQKILWWMVRTTDGGLVGWLSEGATYLHEGETTPRGEYWLEPVVAPEIPQLSRLQLAVAAAIAAFLETLLSEG